jgi:hypothetical protein
MTVTIILRSSAIQRNSQKTSGSGRNRLVIKIKFRIVNRSIVRFILNSESEQASGFGLEHK